MLTSKPISTIHYCDIKELQVLLNQLYNDNAIMFYTIIKHIKEQDEKKDHLHVFIIPNGRINTDKLREHLEIFDPLKPDLPIRPLPFNTSKWQDFYLYVKHDEDYLQSKGQGRQFHYNNLDFVSSDEDYFNELIHTIDFSKYKKQQQVIDMCRIGFEFSDLVASNLIPVQLINQYEKLYRYTALDSNKKHDKNGEKIKGSTYN